MQLEPAAMLLSLHPRFARLIYSDEKRAELRRVGPSRPIRIAYIYETAPVCRVTGWVRFLDIETDASENLWDKYGADLAISLTEFQSYVSGCTRPTVLSIESHRRFRRHIPLKNLHTPSRPPQSYCYFEPGRPIHRR
jgi:predicted transcriptional regulator